MISIITPFCKQHEKYIGETYESILSQTYNFYEWVLIPNGGAVVPEKIKNDSRVKIFDYNSGPEEKEKCSIGKLKRFACKMATGEIVVELDDDDLLFPSCLAEVADAFNSPQVMFVYSDDVHFVDKTWESVAFGTYWGWKHREFEYEGHKLKVNISPEVSIHTLRSILFAPDHVRAWRTSAYWKVGGHNPLLFSGDDHELMCKFYKEYGKAGFKHIEDVLYMYRRHDSNSCVLFNNEVLREVDRNYCKYHREMLARWAKDEQLSKVNLGGRFNNPAGYISVDMEKPADIISDLNDAFPFEDDSVGVIMAYHIFEHLKDPIHTMNECYRVLVPGGWLLIEVPSTDGRGAFQDPGHVSFWNANSIWYYTNKDYARYIQPRYKGRFQVSRSVTYFPNDFYRRNSIPLLQTDLICLKEPYESKRMGGMFI